MIPTELINIIKSKGNCKDDGDSGTIGAYVACDDCPIVKQCDDTYGYNKDEMPSHDEIYVMAMEEVRQNYTEEDLFEGLL